MQIRRLGGGGRLLECERMLAEWLSHIGGELILLPIPTTRDNIYITGTDIKLDDVSLDNKCVALAGYNIPLKLGERAEKCGMRVVDVSTDETFQCDNAILTAKGALGFILTHVSSDISDISIGIVGYGRIGSRLTRLLLQLGADPIVYTTRLSVVLEMGEAGVRAELLGEENDLASLDFLINTAPADMNLADRLSDTAQIIDLASGTNFPPDERLTRLPSIPDKMYPLSAGRVYAKAIVRGFANRGAV